MKAAPDQALDGGSAQGVPDRERDPERRDDPEQVHAVDRPDQRAVVQILPVEPALFHPEVREHPADVRVDESLQRLAHPVTVPRVRRVRVALLIGERVVLSVIGDPLGQRPLHGHAAEDRGGRLDGRARLEGTREVAVEADRDAESAPHAHCDDDRDVDGMERDVPENPGWTNICSGGTMTAISVTTWLIRLVRGRTVPTEAFSGAATGTGTSDTANESSHVREQRLLRIANVSVGTMKK